MTGSNDINPRERERERERTHIDKRQQATQFNNGEEQLYTTTTPCNNWQQRQTATADNIDRRQRQASTTCIGDRQQRKKQRHARKKGSSDREQVAR